MVGQSGKEIKNPWGACSELVRIGHAGIKEDLMGPAWMNCWLNKYVVGWLAGLGGVF